MFHKMCPLAATLISVAIILMTGCGKPEIAARVNGEPIYMKEIDRQIINIKRKQSGMFEGPEGKKLEKELREMILETLINFRLKDQDAARSGTKVSEEEIEKKLAVVRGVFKTPEEYQNALKAEQMTEKELRRDIKQRIARQKRQDYLVRNVKVGQKEIEEYYRKNLKDYVQQPEKIQTSHILVSSRKEAEALLKQLEAGADFGELAQKYSKDTTTKANGGDIGLKARDELEKEYAETAFSLQIGEVSSPVKTQAGYHLIKLIAKQPPVHQPLEEVRPSISELLLKTKRDKVFEKWFSELRRKAKIERLI